MRERVFHFSSESLAKVKAKANAESDTTKISSLQALSAHVWRCITRTRNLPPDQETSCMMAINNRTRLCPPVPQEYVGNCIQAVRATAADGELLDRGLGGSCSKLHLAVHNHTDEIVRNWVESWLQSHVIYPAAEFIDPCSALLGSSQRFNLYGSEFGRGNVVEIRSGYANKFDGKVSSFPGIEGSGSIDLEICLRPHSMSLLESDEEFMGAVTLSSSRD